ncbi:hypothetical protein OPW33_24275 [Vibrio europaeus]|uniref:hypothetical protein n=1 Tax=Vibrio europaeus TaxID=300876 RepID=UPI0023404CE5|nr:hypothetical protein [Vibrio europaeus]MDC5840189.1 hypothetical protein [Vibrio europaeus]MDC5840208.1 hypothetical protein [Vibrio europaeus]MDC5842447.1 hypothetical protein [Vibrio europaeus]
MQTVITSPIAKPFVASGRVFKLLSGGQVHLRFRGVNDEWSEEFDLVPGDSITFKRDFFNIEFSSEFETTVRFYAGFADMKRSVTDLIQLGASTLHTDGATAEKTQKQLVPARPNRRSLTILPLNAMIYVGASGVDVNKQIPIAAGQPLTLDITSNLYFTLDPNHAQDSADVRILEEIN